MASEHWLTSSRFREWQNYRFYPERLSGQELAAVGRKQCHILPSSALRELVLNVPKAAIANDHPRRLTPRLSGVRAAQPVAGPTKHNEQLDRVTLMLLA